MAGVAILKGTWTLEVGPRTDDRHTAHAILTLTTPESAIQVPPASVKLSAVQSALLAQTSNDIFTSANAAWR